MNTAKHQYIDKIRTVATYPTYQTERSTRFRAALLFAAFAATAGLAFIGAATTAKGEPAVAVADASAHPEGQWITGTVFTQESILLFRCDKPVKDNKTGAVVLLGTTREAASIFLPILVKAAQKKMELRLFGVLLSAPPQGKFPGKHSMPIPDVQFRTWKFHLPSDPDVLPPNQRIIVQ